MSKKKYIVLQLTNYGYEIYAVKENKKIKLNPKDKIRMYQILKKFQYTKKGATTYIFSNYEQIKLSFLKSQLTPEQKRVNRQKSIQLIGGVVLAVTTMASAAHMSVADTNKTPPSLPDTKPGIVQIDNQLDIPSVKPISSHYYNESISLEEQSQEKTNEDLNINTFCYEFSTPGDKEALINSQSYQNIFDKFEKRYGVDAKLLCAIGAQESSGRHYKESMNGGHATGIMGIENIWDGGEIRVFNFESNSYETIIVDYSRIGELEYNIKIGAAIFQNYFYNTLKNASFMPESDYMAFTLQKYNMGPGNMKTILSYGEDWIENRNMINAGDSLYFEHVLSRLDNDTIIKIRLTDGSYYQTKVINQSFTKNYQRR